MRNTAMLVVSCMVAIEAGAAAAGLPGAGGAPAGQAAVTAASDGDVIRVAAGRWCGASIDREVHLVGAPGATIQGCASLTDFGGLRLGFLLVDDRASGTSITGFRFDGRGISTTNTDP